MTDTIRVMNTTDRKITLKSFDNDEVDVNPTKAGQSVPVDKKFDWNLPRGIKNLDAPKEIFKPSNPAPVESPAIPDVPATPLKLK